MAPKFLGLAIAMGLFSLAIAFIVLEWSDRRRRAADLPGAEARYFAVKDVRRLAGSLMMVLIALGMVVGLTLDPRRGRAVRQVWATSWLAVMILVVLLLSLALWDWIALRHYAVRQRVVLDRERRAVVEDARRLIRPTDRPPGDDDAGDRP
jgi:hypothetical protein